MPFVRDEGSVFPAPLERVWAFVGSGARHGRAHGHSAMRRRRRSPREGTYSWTQPFEGTESRFVMRWHAYYPLGIAYDVLEGPFRGSRFFLFYEARGSETAVTVLGDFRSPTLPASRIPTAVLDFFALEFEQDRRAIVADLAAARTGQARSPTPSGRVHDGPGRSSRRPRQPRRPRSLPRTRPGRARGRRREGPPAR